VKEKAKKKEVTLIQKFLKREKRKSIKENFAKT